jgi:1-acyl-sn-glycerol-3-phosphate acyltransferase
MYIESGIAAADPREKRRYFIETTNTRKILTPTVRMLFSILAKMKVSGVEHLPSHGPVVLAANHMTIFDVFPMQFALPRLIYYMGKAELFQNPILDPILRRLGGFPVYRGEKDIWALRHAQKVLDAGEVLGIFPEGTRSRGTGLRPAKTGAARLAIQAGCPIVPMAVNGTQNLLSRFPWRGQVEISLGAPIYPEPHDSALALTDKIMFHLAALLPEHMRGAYAEAPKGYAWEVGD